MTKAFTLIEMLATVLIITILTAIAVPYYQNAVQSAKHTEALIWWGQVKRFGSFKSMNEERAERMEKSANERLKHFTLQILCQEKEPALNQPCWEALLELKKEDQAIQYFLASQNNFAQLLCVPLNKAGENFCQVQSGQEGAADARWQDKPAYLLRH